MLENTESSCPVDLITRKDIRMWNWIILQGTETELGFQTMCRLFKQSNADLINSMRGIPLTGKWLERCGFINVPKKSLCYSGPFLLIDHNEDCIYCFAYGDKTAQIQYVHQLQNLYYILTGEELQVSSLITS
jgi:hypothetical protein